MNSDNLTPFNRMSPERQREIARMGGKASGAARRRKAYQRRTLSFLLRVCDEHGANSEQSKSPPDRKTRFKSVALHSVGLLTISAALARVEPPYPRKRSSNTRDRCHRSL